MTEISFCQTCGNRRSFAEETLPHNIQLVEKLDAEIVLLDYGSTDRLVDLVKALNHPRIKYWRYEASQFNVAHAKNLAHKLAQGRVVVNLDIDNYLLECSFCEYLELQDNTVLQGFVNQVNRSVINDKSIMMSDGSFGRIAMTKKTFDILRGYDERMLNLGYADKDLLIRAKAKGMRMVHSSIRSPVISHPKNEGWINMASMNEKIGKNPHRIVNPSGWGNGNVSTM